MSIKSNKEITLIKKKKNRKVILIVEDEYDWCFPEFVWEHIKNFVGIFNKVNQFDRPFLALIQSYYGYHNNKCLTKGQARMGINIYKQVLSRCLKDPTYCRLQAYKWFKKYPPQRKGYEFIGARSYDLENMGDKTCDYRIRYHNPIPKECGPISQERVEAKFWEDFNSNKFTKISNGRKVTRLNTSQMKIYVKKDEEKPIDSKQAAKVFAAKSLLLGIITKCEGCEDPIDIEGKYWFSRKNKFWCSDCLVF